MTVTSRASLLALLLCAACGGDEPAPPPSAPCDGQPSGTACTWLGLPGQEGFDGDGRPAHETRVNQPQDLVFLPDGRAWLSDFNNHLVRQVDPDGTVTTVVGWTDPIFPGDGPQGGPPPGGAAGADWQLFHPSGMVLADDAVIVAAWHNHKLLTVDAESGWVDVLCGGGPDGGGSGFSGDEAPATQALLEQPSDATVDDDGNVYLVDQLNQRIRRIDPDGIIHTFAGTGEKGDFGDGGPAVDARLSWADGSNPNPGGAVLHHEGKIYVADTDNHRVRVIDRQTGIIDAFAGTGAPGYAGDGGPATEAELQGPRDMAIGPDGDLYIADTDNGTVRAIDLADGTIRTVVGTGTLGLSDDEPLPATQTPLRRPFGLAFDAAGDLYVVDTLNSRIVRVKR